MGRGAPVEFSRYLHGRSGSTNPRSGSIRRGATMDKPCILLVEDSDPHATVAKYALAAGGVRVEHCATLAAALERLGETDRPPPTAVVLDLTLPDSGGMETFDRVAAAGASPIVVLSAADDPGQALALIERGAQDYLVKGQNTGPAIARAVRQAIERGRLREEQRRAREQAEAAVRAQRSFVAAMSHEVRTPLNAILGMSELLAQTPLSPNQREYVEIARRCGRALQNLLDNALELSRLESGAAEISYEAFDLEGVVRECLEAFSFAAHQKGIALIADLHDDAIGTVIGDEGRLRQVLFNLVGNAVKFTERGRVCVRAHSDGEHFAIAVIDTGIGIPHDRQAAVFERFVQAESGTTRRYGGSGLGLPLCRELGGVVGRGSGAPGACSASRCRGACACTRARRRSPAGGSSSRSPTRSSGPRSPRACASAVRSRTRPPLPGRQRACSAPMRRSMRCSSMRAFLRSTGSSCSSASLPASARKCDASYCFRSIIASGRCLAVRRPARSRWASRSAGRRSSARCAMGSPHRPQRRALPSRRS